MLPASPFPETLMRLVVRALTLLCAVFAAYFIGLYLFIALSRIQYPFELEWMEGGMVDHVRQILNHQKLYAAPSVEFTPFIYPPLYFYASALAAQLLGTGFFPLRLVSLLASLGCFGILFQWARKETGKIEPGLLAAGLYAATFPLSGAWFDIARVDSLFLFLLLAALYLARFAEKLPVVFLLAVVLTLAGLTKQTGFFMAAPLALYFFLTRPKHCFFFILASAAGMGGSYLWLNFIHDGWYHYYLFEIPHQHEIYWQTLNYFWRSDLLHPLGITCGIGILYGVRTVFKTSRREAFFYWPVGLGMLVITALSRAHSQAYSNVLFPAYALIALLAALGAGRAEKEISPRYSLHLLSTGLIALLLLVQMGRLTYSPKPHIPTPQDRLAGQRLIQLMRSVDGEVFMPYHGFLPALAGKQTFSQAMAVFDVTRIGDRHGAELVEDLRKTVRTGRFEMIIVDYLPGFLVFGEELAAHYHKTEDVFSDPSVFWPITGSRFRPQQVYRKN